MDPLVPNVKSCTMACKPAGVSRSVTRTLSPGFIWKVVPGNTPNLVLKSGFNGSAAVCETPFVVRKAKLTGSRPTLFWQSWLFAVLVKSWKLKLSIVIATHHKVGSEQVFRPAGG